MEDTTADKSVACDIQYAGNTNLHLELLSYYVRQREGEYKLAASFGRKKTNTATATTIALIYIHMQKNSTRTTPWPSWLRRKTVNLEIVSSILTGVVYFFDIGH